ncbi:dynein regulatory complex protein 9 [Callorhinchus milii]|uniref:Dynein regulatory complex protein 9 n=2 Tax=Callorhinchus milii TaxID=7868 RepID=A0A4W3HW51_CALMI|nr:dynein regulatory complex protein 9 [Callorhinchus milii]|eukprot:gi/632934111/ref/XP_007899856.1/ PREDICTED: IQ domain-containing protein G [Callorhinchus milii]
MSSNAELLRKTREMEPLSRTTILQVSTVLKECLDQLAILGYIMPVSYEEKSDMENIVGSEIDQIVFSQKSLEYKYEEIMLSKNIERMSGMLNAARLVELGDQLQETSRDIKRSNWLFSNSFQNSPVTPDNLIKVQADRQVAMDVIADTLHEITTSGTFLTLINAVRFENEKKADNQNTIIREEEGRKKIAVLQRHLQDMRQEKESELQRKDEIIAHLKDQLQEMKAKTNMERKYMKKNAELQVLQTQKKCAQNEQELQDEFECLKNKTDQEIRVHLEIENFLKQHQTEMEENLEHWMEKYDKDTDAKQLELNFLKITKSNDVERLKNLSAQYLMSEQVIIEDRKERDNERKRRIQEETELNAIIKLQSWWRGEMVRRGIGNTKLKKAKKGKDDKGKGKGKGKGKDKGKKKK